MKFDGLEKYQAQADILKALAHPSRLFIVELLKEKDLCVCDITDKIQSDVSTVSRHLNRLKQVGVISSRKEGAMVIYSLKMCCFSNLLDCVENVLKQRAETLVSFS